MKITGIILAGGKSERMGQDKGLVPFREKPLIQHVIEALRKAGISEIMIISNQQGYDRFSLPVYPDAIRDKGPLGGIYSGLLNSKTQQNIVLSCDIPFIDEKLISMLLESSPENQNTVTSYRNQIHPLIGIYHLSLLASLEKSLTLNRLKVRDFIRENGFKLLELKDGPDMNFEKKLANLNTKDELTSWNDGM